MINYFNTMKKNQTDLENILWSSKFLKNSNIKDYLNIGKD